MIQKTPEEAYRTASVADERLPELEHIILTSSFYAYFYAGTVIKGRWIEAEDLIMTNIRMSYFYAKNIIRGKLPEKMHNMMILHGIEDPNDIFVKDYFEFIK